MTFSLILPPSEKNISFQTDKKMIALRKMGMYSVIQVL